MILFLDTVSSLPEFSLIEDNKIIYSEKILIDNQQRMSDYIIPSYIQLKKFITYKKKINLLIANTGPGSYTSMRVGISFLSGLRLASNISLIGITCLDLFMYLINKEDLHSTAIFISSSNNQNFICVYDPYKNNFKIDKVDFITIKDTLKKFNIKQILINDQKSIEKKIFDNIEVKEIKFSDLVLENIQKIKFLAPSDIVKPIYISDNKILN